VNSARSTANKPDIAFINAVLKQDFKLVDQYLEKSDVQILLNGEDHGRTALMYAAERGYTDAVEHLIVYGGADPNYISSYCKTALDFAIARSHTEVEMLLRSYDGKRAAELELIPANVVEQNPRKEKKKKRLSASPVLQEEQDFLDETVEIVSARLKDLKKASRLAGSDKWTRRSLTQHNEQKVKELEEFFHNPYFGRIDIQLDHKKTKDSYYIGRDGVADQSGQIRVIKWTAPAASLFYAKRLGRIEENSVGSGEVNLIRDIKIEDLVIKDIQDLGAQNIFDPILLARLEGNTQNQMQDIVQTIQAEQDRIIRLPRNKPVIVQGSAGSGKTTVALHRAAYLFHNEPDLLPEKMIVFGPNEFFMSYISSVLPGLGMNGVEQVSFETWAQKRLSRSRFVVQASDVSTANSDPLFAKWSKWRGAMSTKKVWDELIERGIDSASPKHGISISNDHFVFELNNSTLRKWYSTDYKYDIATVRKEKIIKRIKGQFEHYQKQETKKISKMEENLQDKIKVALSKAKSELEEMKKNEGADRSLKDVELSEQDIMASNQELIHLREKINLLTEEFSTFKRLASDQQDRLKKNWSIANEHELYFACCSDKDWLTNHLVDWEPEEIESIHRYINRQRNNKQLDYEDLAPLLYIHRAIIGSTGMEKVEKKPSKKSKTKDEIITTFTREEYQYAIIDEGQDFSPFQIWLISQHASQGNMMILGDLGQSIYSYRGITRWEDAAEVFSAESSIKTLTTSYRSTVEILEAANTIIAPWSQGKFELSQPILRHGQKPASFQYADTAAMAAALPYLIEELQAEGMSQIAIITKNKELHPLIKNVLDAAGVSIETFADPGSSKTGGLSLMEAAMSKGLEFDAVLLFDVSADVYESSELDRKLLYVAFTRALHKVYMVYTVPTKLISKIWPSKTTQKVLDEHEKAEKKMHMLLEEIEVDKKKLQSLFALLKQEDLNQFQFWVSSRSHEIFVAEIIGENRYRVSDQVIETVSSKLSNAYYTKLQSILTSSEVALIAQITSFFKNCERTFEKINEAEHGQRPISSFIEAMVNAISNVSTLGSLMSSWVAKSKQIESSLPVAILAKGIVTPIFLANVAGPAYIENTLRQWDSPDLIDFRGNDIAWIYTDAIAKHWDETFIAIDEIAASIFPAKA